MKYSWSRQMEQTD